MARSCSALRLALLQPLPADGIQGRRPTSTGRREVASSHSRVTDGPAPNTRESNAGRLQQSLERFQHLVSEGVKPPDGLCNEVLQGLCAKHRLADARRAYDTAAALGCALRYSTYHQLSLAAAQGGDSVWAVALLRAMPAAGLRPNAVTTCSLISALCRDRRRGVRSAQLALDVWQGLRASGEHLDAAAYRAGMHVCVKTGRLPDADALLAEMAGRGMAPDARAYNILLSAHVRSGARDAAARVLARMDTSGVARTAATYGTLVDLHVRCGELAEAERLLGEAAASGTPADAWAYGAIIRGHAQARDARSARATFDEMQRAGVEPAAATWSGLVDAYARCGRTADARAALAAMLRAVPLRGPGESRSAASAASAVLRCLAAGGGPDALRDALRLLRELHDAPGLPPPETDAFNTLMAAAVAAGEPALALDLRQQMAASGQHLDALTYTTLIMAHSMLGCLPDAVATFEALARDPGAALDLPAYNAMVHALARAGEMAAAESMLDTARRLAEAQGVPPPVEAYGAAVAGYARLRQVDAAVATVRAFHAAGGAPDVRMLDTLADLCVREGEFRRAWQAVRAIELLGVPVDKIKYRQLVARVASARATGLAAREAGGGEGAQRAKRERKRAGQHSEALERLKFWLGLPNAYYSSENWRTLETLQSEDIVDVEPAQGLGMEPLLEQEPRLRQAR